MVEHNLKATRWQKRGGGEIRTHEAFRPSGFQDRRIQPLCHPSRKIRSRELCHWLRVGQGVRAQGGSSSPLLDDRNGGEAALSSIVRRSGRSTSRPTRQV